MSKPMPNENPVCSGLRRIRHLLAMGAACCLLASGCVYELDVQQGNKLEPADIEKIQVGMTRNQVRFVLGTPVIGDVFHNDRWDYLYYFRPGRSLKAERRWIIVWFDGDTVREIQRDVRTKPG